MFERYKIKWEIDSCVCVYLNAYAQGKCNKNVDYILICKNK